MKMNERFVFLDDSVLRKYLKDTMDIKVLTSGSYYELVTAFFVNALYTNIYKEGSIIGFPAKLPPSHGQRLDNTQECEDFFQNSALEDTIIDFILAPVETFNLKKKVHSALIFQVKRFGVKENAKDTVSLVEYIRNLKNKYPKTNTNLILVIDVSNGIDLNKVVELLKREELPFRSVQYLHFRFIEDGAVHAELGYLWPEKCCWRFDLKKYWNDDVFIEIPY